MPELMVDLITSLDGYASAEGWPGWWGLEGPEYLGWLEQDQPERGYLTLMGANTYRVMSQLSTDAAGGGDFRPEETDSLTSLDTAPKVIFSSTLTEPLVWPDARLVTTDAVEAVRTMKAEGDLPLRTLGSIRLCRSLLAAGLVDRFRLVVFPVITGATGGERVYDGYPDVALDLVESRTFDGRSQLLDYVPRLLDRPPSGG